MLTHRKVYPNDSSALSLLYRMTMKKIRKKNFLLMDIRNVMPQNSNKTYAFLFKATCRSILFMG